jgi:hypothetical protein
MRDFSNGQRQLYFLAVFPQQRDHSSVSGSGGAELSSLFADKAHEPRLVNVPVKSVDFFDVLKESAQLALKQSMDKEVVAIGLGSILEKVA